VGRLHELLLAVGRACLARAVIARPTIAGRSAGSRRVASASMLLQNRSATAKISRTMTARIGPPTLRDPRAGAVMVAALDRITCASLVRLGAGATHFRPAASAGCRPARFVPMRRCALVSLCGSCGHLCSSIAVQRTPL
jgi:hypothetical protein